MNDIHRMNKGKRTSDLLSPLKALLGMNLMGLDVLAESILARIF